MCCCDENPAKVCGSMRIEVTQADIDGGRRGSAFYCPIARAERRVIGDTRMHIQVCVNRQWGWIGGYWFGKPVSLPDEAAGFAGRFDRGEPVEPFAFDLPIDLAATKGG